VGGVGSSGGGGGGGGVGCMLLDNYKEVWLWMLPASFLRRGCVLFVSWGGGGLGGFFMSVALCWDSQTGLDK